MTLRRIFFWLAIGYIFFFQVFYFFAPEPLGMLEAKFDLWRGHYEIRVYGLIILPEGLLTQSIKEYGIEYKRVAGCVVNHFLVGYVQGYNAVMKEEIARVFPEEVTRLIRS